MTFDHLIHISRFPHSRITHHASRFTSHVSRLTFLPTPTGFHISAQWLRRSAVLRRYPGSTVQQNSPTLKAVVSCSEFLRLKSFRVTQSLRAGQAIPSSLVMVSDGGRSAELQLCAVQIHYVRAELELCAPPSLSYAHWHI